MQWRENLLGDRSVTTGRGLLEINITGPGCPCEYDYDVGTEHAQHAQQDQVLLIKGAGSQPYSRCWGGCKYIKSVTNTCVGTHSKHSRHIWILFGPSGLAKQSSRIAEDQYRLQSSVHGSHVRSYRAPISIPKDTNHPRRLSWFMHPGSKTLRLYSLAPVTR
jgi:hypothetical protein